MSLMKTLAKVAIGVAVAKGASAMMNKRSSSGGGGAEQSGLGGLLGGLTAGGSDRAGQSGLGGLLGGLAGASGGAQASQGGLQDMLGGLMGGVQGAGAAGSTGGLGGLLEGLGGGSGGQGGGLQGMLEGLAGGGGGAGGLLGALGAGMATRQRPADNGASFGQVLNSNFDQTPETPIEPTADQEAAAALMLRAMIQAAKSDGQLDAGEQENLMGQLGGDIDAEEAAFLRAEMDAPVDVDALVQQVPNGMGAQVYAMSLLAINLDSQAEAQYLHKLAQGLGLDARSINDVHAQLGVPSLYT